MTSEKPILKGPLYGRIARISRPKLNAPGLHEGVQMLDGRVAHTSWGRNTQVCSFEEFASGHPVRLEHLVPHTLSIHSLNALNAEIRRNARYDLLNYNCEIFARRAVLQKSESPQVGFWTAVLAITGIWYASTAS
ncbi:MAG: hypothetical protein A3J24_09940 [Deltaproteobacteria bacterium RIFCSPLOWO2_02_FULL_53_8]|nr:MAG: hypothetical protein A3J24_09940 [Deltaproteobacteria bacterium RIFCSPLOWO2_02_FULL_53_8]